MCDTGPLYISSLTHNEHGHHQDYEVNYRLHLAKANVKSLQLMENKLKCMDNSNTYFKV